MGDLWITREAHILTIANMSSVISYKTMMLRPIYGLFLLFLALAAPGISRAETVKDVALQYMGAETVARSVIMAQIRTSVGSELDPVAVEEDIKTLYASGHIDNVRVLTEPHDGGVRVIFLVQTRAILGEVVFIGNSLGGNKLRGETELEIGKPFDDKILERARENLKDYYKKKGFSNVELTYKVDGAKQPGFSRVSFVINEGVHEKLNQVKFFGNESISDRELAGQMHVKTGRVFNIFKKNRGIDSAVLEEDVARVEEFYHDRGFINARVTNVEREPAGDKVNLVLHVSEGEKYTVNKVTVTGIEAISHDDVIPLLEMKSGGVYSSSGIKTDLKGLRKYYGNNGYSNVRIMPRISDAGGTSVDIEYGVSEGVQTTVELVNISGNDKTLDKVIRRELVLAPGDVFSQDYLEVSRNRLMGLGFFETVEITPTAAATAHHTDINISVREKSTGSVNFGAGFSSIDNLVGFMDVMQTNFRLFGRPKTGGGEKIRLGLKYGTRRKDFQFDYTQPWLFDKKLAFSSGVYYRDLLFLSDKYDQTVMGGYGGLRKPLGEHTALTFKANLENYEIDVEQDASDILLEEDGEYSRALLALTYVWDTRDSQYLTRRGHRASIGVDGSFGDVETYGLQLSAAKYIQLPFDTVLTVSGKYRTVGGSDDIPIFEREFLGGANNLRGYDYREAAGQSLRDDQGEPLGGQTAASFTAEYSFPIANFRKLRGHVFYDGGVLSKNSWDFGGDYLSDVGIGVDVYLAIGPIRVDLAWPLQKDEWVEDDVRIQFNMGYQFR